MGDDGPRGFILTRGPRLEKKFSSIHKKRTVAHHQVSVFLGAKSEEKVTFFCEGDEVGFGRTPRVVNPLLQSFQGGSSAQNFSNGGEGEGVLAIVDHVLGDPQSEFTILPNWKG